jgi:hypothetical protein
MTVVDFFFDMFSTSSKFLFFPKNVIGPDASEKHFRSSGGVREGIWGCPGGVRETSWRVLGFSGGVRGASWEGFGRSWGDLGATFKAVRCRIDFLIDVKLQKGAKREAFGEPKWEPKSSPKRVKIEVDFQERKNTLQDRLGSVLRPS